MLRVILALVIALLAGPVFAQQPAPPATPLSQEALVHALERDVAVLQLRALESDYARLRRELETKVGAAETALTDEAMKAKIDPKAHRADPASKTWRKVQ